MASAFTALIVQVGIEASTANILSSLFAFVGISASALYLLDDKRFRRTPISSIGLLTYAFGSQWLPLLYSTLTLQTISHGLNLPLLDFGYTCLTILILLVAHVVYSRTQAMQKCRRLLTRVETRLKLFEIPSDAQLWVIGLIGFVATVIAKFGLGDTGGVAGSGGTPGATASGPLAQALGQMIVFSFAPFAIPFRPLFSDEDPKKARTGWIVLYGFALLLFTIARNVRATIAEPIADALFALILGFAVHRMRMTKKLANIAIISLALAFFLAPMFENLSTVMIIVRKDKIRGASAMMIAEKTIGLLANPDELQQQQNALTEKGFKLTDYYSTSLISRLFNPQTLDASLGYGTTLDPQNTARLGTFESQKMLEVFPSPMLDALGISVNKKYVTSMSVNDYLRYLATGAPASGFSTGGFVGEGTALLKEGFWPFVFFLGLFWSAVLDSSVLAPMVLRMRREADEQSNLVFVENPRFSPMMAFNGFTFISIFVWGDSTTDFVIQSCRWMPELVVMYWVLFKVSNVVTRVIGIRQPIPGRPALEGEGFA